MRKLNAKQKSLLVKVLKENDIHRYSDLSFEIQDELDKINIFENLISEVDRFISDYNWKKVRGE